MNNKYIFGGFIIVIFLGIMIYLFTQTSVTYEENFSNVMSTPKTLKATGSWVKEKRYSNKNNMFSFYMVDYLGNQMKVEYKGTMPNNFESSTSVVVTGKFKNGVFEASEILTKCPSKYEEEFEKQSSS